MNHGMDIAHTTRIATKKATLVGLAACLLMTGAACTPTEAVRGNLVENYQVSEVKVGVDTRADVLHKLGSPTTQAPFDPNIWYYVGQKTEKRGILDPDVKEQRVYVAKFDENGTLIAFDKGSGGREDVPYVRDKTPTSGQEMTVMQQFVGNLGRFNKEGAGAKNASTTGDADGN